MYSYFNNLGLVTHWVQFKGGFLSESSFQIQPWTHIRCYNIIGIIFEFDKCFIQIDINFNFDPCKF